MPPAVIAGGVAAAGAIGGAVIGAKAQKSAASQAADAQNQAAQMQFQLGQESLDLNKQIYNSNYGTLSPFVSRGNVAGDSINALLGLPSAPKMASPLATPTGGTSGGSSGGSSGSSPYTAAQINGMWHDGIDGNAEAAQRANAAWYASHPNGAATAATPTATAERPHLADYRGDMAGYRDAQADYRASHTTTPAATGTTGGAAGGALTPAKAFENFANSAGMKFQLDQGADMLNNRYAAAGALQSGAAMKAMQGYGQQTALNNYFLPYMGLLSGQQAIGAGAASSIAGVGQNFGNTAANINGQMGQALQGGADATSNAALLRGQANAGMWSQIGSSLGSLASSFVPTGGAKF